MLQTLYQKPFQRDYEINLEIEDDAQALDKFSFQPNQYIIIQSDAANGQYDAKVWHKKSFISLIDQLLAQTQLQIVLVGDAGDYIRTIKFIEEKFASESRVVNTAGKTNIAELLQLIKVFQFVHFLSSSLPFIYTSLLHLEFEFQMLHLIHLKLLGC